MNIKKPLATALAILFGTAALSAHAADGVVKVTGSVVGDTCTVGGAPIDTGGPQGVMQTISVQLDPVSVTALDAAGKYAGSKDFQIALSKCTAKNIKVVFDGMGTVDSSTGMMLNKGGATNVQVALAPADANGSEAIHIGSDPGQVVTLSDTGDGAVDYKASYVAVGGAATPGTVDATVMFSLIYN
ncbi:type 1 fimbrial protein [Pseudomonas aeruginosa]|uniref:fimbrial protein n=1 Tax=Pseudomonas aeruginosa TaxID=287 RepID=UPI000717BAD5|nr:fimbrial protein [Pseudomonas aeruginosa]KRV04304.1 hypothetical protein AN455_29135 [Pseudomonas aeruginosa]KRV12347.1 hypothetical protein AN456_28990 [Pseudomonas aeruginosa]MCT2415650.1 type 1 fimbrial protein [Pseudomonas aeruginosa]RTU08937.1 type 1 fimbrial protein [Pseudomonas aeruginosa]SQC94961.1 fimbrial subunit protein [Pseudomonas aeruginosa]